MQKRRNAKGEKDLVRGEVERNNEELEEGDERKRVQSRSSRSFPCLPRTTSFHPLSLLPTLSSHSPKSSKQIPSRSDDSSSSLLLFRRSIVGSGRVGERRRSSAVVGSSPLEGGGSRGRGSDGGSSSRSDGAGSGVGVGNDEGSRGGGVDGRRGFRLSVREGSGGGIDGEGSHGDL